MRRPRNRRVHFPAGLAECTAVECNERLIAPAACIVDALCKNFLSGACLTHQKNIGIILCEKGPRFSLPDGWRQIHRSDSGRYILPYVLDIGFSSQLLFPSVPDEEVQ